LILLYPSQWDLLNGLVNTTKHAFSLNLDADWASPGWVTVVAAEAVFFNVLVNFWADDSVHQAVWREYPITTPASPKH
jgi:hypothetical protein